MFAKKSSIQCTIEFHYLPSGAFVFVYLLEYFIHLLIQSRRSIVKRRRKSVILFVHTIPQNRDPYHLYTYICIDYNGTNAGMYANVLRSCERLGFAKYLKCCKNVNHILLIPNMPLLQLQTYRYKDECVAGYVPGCL